MLHAGSKIERPGARFVGTSERRYKLCSSGNDAGSRLVGILVKEEISGNVEVRRKSDRVMAIELTLNREVIQIIYVWVGHSGRPGT